MSEIINNDDHELDETGHAILTQKDKNQIITNSIALTDGCPATFPGGLDRQTAALLKAFIRETAKTAHEYGAGNSIRLLCNRVDLMKADGE